jgi:hypothetical protein
MAHKTLDRDKSTELGSHPVGTGVGAAAGGLAGAAAAGAIAGSSVGPAGTLVGALAGAVVGGLAGKGIAELVDPSAEDAYWRDTYSTRPYVTPGSTYDDYGPAYRYGVDSYGRYEGRPFDEIETDLERDWSRARGESKLAWENAKHATRDSWQRVSDAVERAVPGDSDRDGK